MSDIIHYQRATDLEFELDDLSRPLRQQRPEIHWISTPDGDQGSEWCGRCGHFKVRHLQRHDRKRRDSYFLDGGWRTEEDGFRYCCACGVQLDVGLTTYGALEAIESLDHFGIRPGNAEDAADLSEILSTLAWHEPQNAGAVERAADLAEALLWSAT